MISPSFGKTMIEILTKTTDNYGPRELCIKTIQNVTIFLSDQTKKKNEKLSKKAKAISFSCRDARIAYSFPKICKAIAGLHNISQKINTMTPYAATLAKFDMGVFASQITFLLFQNSSLLARLGVMNKKKAGFYTKMFGAFWTVYILIVSSKKYYELKHLAPSKDEEKNKENYDNVINENGMTDAAEVMEDLEKANEVRKSVQRTEMTDNVIDSRIGDTRDSESLSEEQKENNIKFLERIRAFFHNLFRIKTDEEKAAIKAEKEKKKVEKLQKKEEAKQMRAALKAEKEKAETTEEVKVEQKTMEAVKPVVKEVKTPAPVKAEVKKEISSVDAFIASLRR